MPRPIAAAIVLAVTACLAVPASASAATSSIRITKIHYRQSGTSLDTEYITFKNVSNIKRSITGWRITSSPATDNQSYKFPTTALSAGASLTLYTGHGTNRPGKRYWRSSGPVWNNAGDNAVLTTGAGTLKDRCAYAGVRGVTSFYC